MSKLLSPAALAQVACHEAGHVLMAHFSISCAQINMATIQPNLINQGFVSSEWKILHPRCKWESLCYYLGGVAAEEVVFGKFETSGLGGDLEQVHKLFKSGQIYQPYTGKTTVSNFRQGEISMIYGRCYNTLSKQQVNLLEFAYKSTLMLISANRTLLDLVAVALLNRRTLNKKDINNLLSFNKIRPTWTERFKSAIRLAIS